MSKKGQGWLGILIGLAILLALIYLFFFSSGMGVLVSCDNQEIISIKKAPPPLMAMVQSPICIVNVTVYNNGITICNNFNTIYSSERGIIGCKNLKDFKGKEVRVEATFFNMDNNLTGRDKKNIFINP